MHATREKGGVWVNFSSKRIVPTPSDGTKVWLSAQTKRESGGSHIFGAAPDVLTTCSGLARGRIRGGSSPSQYVIPQGNSSVSQLSLWLEILDLNQFKQQILQNEKPERERFSAEGVSSTLIPNQKYFVYHARGVCVALFPVRRHPHKQTATDRNSSSAVRRDGCDVAVRHNVAMVVVGCYAPWRQRKTKKAHAETGREILYLSKLYCHKKFLKLVDVVFHMFHHFGKCGGMVECLFCNDLSVE